MKKYKSISLTQNKVSIVDEEDYIKISQIKWHYHNRGYAANKNKYMLLLHRYILDVYDKSIIIDHINGDKLDNRKENLRVCSKSQNTRNQKKHTDGISIYKGVSFSTRDKKWYSRIYVDGNQIYLGSFLTEKEAAEAYNVSAKNHFKEFALLNKLE